MVSKIVPGQSRRQTSIGELKETMVKLKLNLQKVTSGEYPRATIIVTQNLDLIGALCARFGKEITIKELADKLYDDANDEHVHQSMH